MKTKIMAWLIRQLGWGWIPSALFQFRRKIRNKLWQSDPGRICVDVCGGTGMILIEKAMQWPKTLFYCIDINEKELEKGRALSAALGLGNVFFIHGDAYSPPFGRDAVDTVIIANILRDLPDVPEFLKVWVDVMKERATLIVETPVAPQIHILFKVSTIRRFVKQHVNPDHGFMNGELESLLGDIGFTIHRQSRAYNGIDVLAREIHYILTAIHPLLSAIFWWPLYLMMVIGTNTDKEGNALTLVACREN